MKLFSNLLTRDFAKERYLAMTQTFPRLREEHTQIYLMLILTFLSCSILGLFAINPTLTTIVDLNRQLEDNLFVNEALKNKMDNLSALHGQHELLKDSWPVVNAAVPDSPNAAYVLGQIQQIASEVGIEVTDLQSFQVELTKKQSNPGQQAASSIVSVSITGSQQQQLQFIQALSNFDRIAAIESITLINETQEVLTVRLRTFFLP